MSSTSRARPWPLLACGLLLILAGLIACNQETEQSSPPSLDTPARPDGFVDTPEISGENAWLHAKAICEIGPRPAGSDGLVKTRVYLTAELERHGWTVTPQAFTQNTPVGEVRFVNLIARFQPEQAPAVAELLLCGHIDTKLYEDFVFIGANDGASHSALLLEFARILAKSPDKARRIELVFFDGEEAFGETINSGPEGHFQPVDGLYGSSHYAKFYRGKKAGEKPRFGIVADMVGHKRLELRIPSDTPAQLYSTYRRASKNIPNGHNHFKVARYPITDDHVPLNQAGIPSIDLIQGNFSRSDWWHQEGDTLDLLAPKSLELSGRLISHMIQDLLAQSAQLR